MTETRRYEAQIAHTTYTLEDELRPHVKITRTNAEGSAVLFVPRHLLMQFAADAMGEVVARLLKKEV